MWDHDENAMAGLDAVFYAATAAKQTESAFCCFVWGEKNESFTWR